MAGTIVPRRGTYTNKTVTLNTVTSFAVINYGATNGLYIRNVSTDDDADSTFVPAGASFSSPATAAYYQEGLKSVVIDGDTTSFTIEAICETPIVV